MTCLRPGIGGSLVTVRTPTCQIQRMKTTPWELRLQTSSPWQRSAEPHLFKSKLALQPASSHRTSSHSTLVRNRIPTSLIPWSTLSGLFLSPAFNNESVLWLLEVPAFVRTKIARAACPVCHHMSMESAQPGAIVAAAAEGAAQRVKPRRPHHKSRNGCVQCKARKIKVRWNLL